jgi:uncharacterized membrane protein
MSRCCRYEDTMIIIIIIIIIIMDYEDNEGYLKMSGTRKSIDKEQIVSVSRISKGVRQFPKFMMIQFTKFCACPSSVTTQNY